MNKKIIDESYEEVINLIQQLIACHPMYGNLGQLKGQKILLEYLNKKGWVTYLDEYSYEDIKNNELVKKPWEYDKSFIDYKHINKHNLYAVLDSKRPGNTLILNGHIDVDIINKTNQIANTVPQLLTDRIKGRGSTDMLSGLCSMVSIKNYLDTVPWRGKVVFTSVVDEEIGGNGSIRACQWMKEKKMLNDIDQVECIIAEPSECNVCYETLGFLPFTISLNSEIKHMNAKSNETNFLKLTNIINQLAQLQILDQKLNVNIGYMHGGHDASLPIDELMLKGVVATTVEYNNDSVIKKLKEYATDLFIPKISITAVRSRNNNFGKSLYHGDIFKSSCDATIFNSFHIPTTVFGPGSLEQAHTEKEYILLSEIERYLTRFYNCVGEYLN